MPSMRAQIQEQSREIDELKRQKQELRQLNALLEGDPAVVKWKAKIRKANEEALIAKEELDRKHEELEEKQEEIDALRTELEEEVEDLKTKLKDEKETNGLKAKLLEVDLKHEKKMSEFFKEQMKKADAKGLEYLKDTGVARQLADTWKQKAAELNQLLEYARQQTASASTQATQMQQECLRLQEIITSHVCTPKVKTESEVEAQLRAAKAEVKDYQNGLEVLREMLRVAEVEHSDIKRATEQKHAKELEELTTELECAYEQLRLERERRSRASGECERASKRKLDAAATDISRGKRTRTKADQPLSDLTLTQ